MKNVCVITGGGSGMGLAAAKYMPKEKRIILSGRTVKKLEHAVAELEELGYEAYAHACDTSDRASVHDVSSNSAYVLPKFLISKKTYLLAETDEEQFLKKLLKKSNLPKGEYERAGFAYAMSKNFVVWYAAKCAFDYGKKGIRVVSLSPGLIATDMGNLEAKEGGDLIHYAAEERMGTPEELGFAIATAADERNGYLAGVDILCDGGSTNGKKEFKRMIAK